MSDAEKVPLTLLEKLAAIRRNVEAVEKQDSTDGDPFTYAPADLVLDVVRTQLQRRKVLALPTRIRESFTDGKPRVALSVVLVDQDNELDRLEVEWIGEGDNAGAAATNALKGIFLATFLIETVEPADVSRREARQRAVRRNGIASTEQLRYRIRRPGVERDLTEAHLLRMANDMLPDEAQITSLDDLPKRLVDKLNVEVLKLEKIGRARA